VASRRYRSKLSLNSNIADINAKVSEISKRPLITGPGENSITNVAITDETIIASNLAQGSVTNEKLAPESVSKSKMTADVFDSVTNTTYTSTPELRLEVPLAEEQVLAGFISPVPTGRIYGLYYPVGMQGAFESITGTGANTATLTVNFIYDVFLPNGGTPIVTTTTSLSTFVCSVSSVTTAGMTLTIRRSDNAVFTTTVGVNWIAMQF
jgi:hypothetical protein